MPRPRDRQFAIGASVIVAAVLTVAFYNSGTPSYQRQLSIDRARVERLRQIAGQLQNRQQLPASLDEIRSQYLRVSDPETDIPFEYRVKDATHYELCATFTAQSEDWEQRPNNRSHWAHPPGRYCYSLDQKVNPWVQ